MRKTRKPRRIAPKRNTRTREPNEIMLSDVFAWALGEPETEITPGYEHIASVAEALLPFWGELRVSDVTAEKREEYIDLRRKAGSKTGKLYARGTVTRETEALLTMIKKAEGPLGYSFTMPIKHHARSIPTVHRTLDRERIIRLLAACRGAQFDGERMRTTVKGAALRDLRLRRGRRGRYILLAAMLGVTDLLARRLRWAPAMEDQPPHSWVDLKTGELHRLGPDLPRIRAYHNVPIRIPRWLLEQMDRWWRHDVALGRTYVLGSETEYKKEVDLRSIARAAGVPNVSPQLLIDSFAANALRTPGVSMFGVAIALGREIRRVEQKYGHFRHDFMAEAVAGTRARPPALNHRKPSSAGLKKTRSKDRRSRSEHVP